jgi:broad specificity phosphatase PhoE
MRHWQTENNKKGAVIGHATNTLTHEGIEQIKKILLEMPLDFSEIYSSDFIRCKQTSDILNQKLDISITYDARLHERNFGSLEEGKNWNEIGIELKELDKNQKYNYQSYGGESVDDVKERIMSFINDIKNTKKDQKILVVTSAGIIRLLHNILNKEIHETIHNGSIHQFKFKD